MNLKRFILWLTFFVVSLILSTSFLIFGVTYWFSSIKDYFYEWGPFKYPQVVWWYPIFISSIFSIFYASYKIHALKCITIDISDNFIDWSWLENRLLGYGYILTEQEGHYVAGFRADYWMAPSVDIVYKNNKFYITGPAFYLKKLLRSYKRYVLFLKAKNKIVFKKKNNKNN